ncbi:MAG: (deoxy)nucleoside triphosphate pyrophosphohydrolase [Spirochaetaceae bacterium]
MRLSVAGIAWTNGRIFVAKRLPGGTNGRRWEFPGGKAAAGEAPKEALVRELREELGMEPKVGELLASGSFAHHGRAYRLEAYRMWLPETPFALREHETTAWVTFEELSELDLVPSDRNLISQLQRVLSK